MEAVHQQTQLFDNQARKDQSSIFFGNIPYDAEDKDLREVFALAGPF
jgi:RNA recognition motif-containing protein